MNELDQILEDLRNGRSNPDSWKVMKKILSGNGDESWTADKQKEFLDAYKDFAYKTPEGKAELQQRLKDTSSQRFTKQFKPFFNAILSGVDLNTSLNQIKSANQTIKSLVQPSIAQSPGIPAELNAQLQQAQSQGGVEAQRALAPVQGELAQQYANDVNTAKQVSGGQGAAYQSAVQGASLRRQRAASNLAQIQDAIKARYQGMANQLATAKGQLGQQDFGNRLYASQLALDQYNRQMAAAGALGQAGRLNLRNTLQGLGDTIPSLFGQILPKTTPMYFQPPQANNGLPLKQGDLNPQGSTPVQLDNVNNYGNEAWNNYALNVKNSLSNLVKQSPSYIPYKY